MQLENRVPHLLVRGGGIDSIVFDDLDVIVTKIILVFIGLSNTMRDHVLTADEMPIGLAVSLAYSLPWSALAYNR